MKNIGILKSTNDEAGADTKILTALSRPGRTIIFNSASVPLLHVFGDLFVLARLSNAIYSLENASTSKGFCTVMQYGQNRK